MTKKHFTTLDLSLSVIIFIIPLIVVLLILLSGRTEEAPQSVTNPCISIGLSCYDLEKATTNEAQIKGLSGRSNMPEKTGMLFIFDTPDQQCMWMKDMKISNDMIWLDESKRVIKIEQKVLPESYPKTYCSESPAKYVIELNGGQVEKNQIRIGDTVSL